jgi:hypothetical protein
MKIPKILNNKILCYALIVLAVLNVIGYITSSAWICLVIFLCTYYGADQYFSNMSASIIAALFVSNFVFGCGRVKETFVENMKGAKEHMNDAAQMAAKGASEAFKEAADAQDQADKSEEDKAQCPPGQERNAEGKCEMKKAAAAAKKDAAEAAAEAASSTADASKTANVAEQVASE